MAIYVVMQPPAGDKAEALVAERGKKQRAIAGARRRVRA